MNTLAHSPLISDTMVSAYIQVIGGVIGVVVGAFIAARLGIREGAKSRTFEFHREFHNESFSKIRNEADLFIREHRQQHYDELRALSHDPGYVSLLAVTRFYQRLAIAAQHKMVRVDLVPDLFGEIFIWWYVMSFELNLQPTKWDIWNDIQWLFELIPKRVSDTSKLTRWLNRATVERQNFETEAQIVDAL